MEIGIVTTLQLGVDVAVCRILSLPIRRDIAIVALNRVISIEVLQVLCFRIAKSLGGLDERVLGATALMSAFAYVDRTVMSMTILVAFAMISFKLMSRQ